MVVFPALQLGDEVRERVADVCRELVEQPGFIDYFEQTTPIEEIEKGMERDKFFSPAEAKEFGLIDEVVVNRPPRPEEAKAA